jgi:hypothetical protein
VPFRRLLAYLWASPCSAVGLLLGAVAIACGGSARRTGPILEVALGDALRRLHWPFNAITFGHVVLGMSHDLLAALRSHELVHVRQYERWGILFFVAYPLSSAVQWLRGRDAYWHNHFEVAARAGEDVAQNASAAR